MTNKPQALDEQMIAKPAAWRWRYVYQDRAGRWTLRSTPIEPHPAQNYLAALEVEPLYTRAAHSLMAAKVAELEDALKDARFCLGALQAQLIGFASPVVNVEFIVGKIDAALAPHPEGTDR